MNYITLDLEWNQAYQEKAIAVQKRLSSRLRGEVIQIGAVKMNGKGDLCGSYSVTVKPRYFRRILSHVARLTGLTQERVDRGISLTEAAESFRRWCGSDYAFLTWGPDDIPMLEDNFRIFGIDASWLANHYDLQPIFNRQTDGGKSQRSLEFAMDYFEIPQNLPAHDALNDAYFTALVAQKLDLHKGIAEYPRKSSDALFETEIGNADVGEDGFVEQRELFSDSAVTSPICPHCGRTLQIGKMLHRRNRRFMASATCEEHGKMYLFVKLFQNFNDTWRATVRIGDATEEEAAYYEEYTTETRSADRRPRRRRHSVKKRVSAEETVAAPSMDS